MRIMMIEPSALPWDGEHQMALIWVSSCMFRNHPNVYCKSLYIRPIVRNTKVVGPRIEVKRRTSIAGEHRNIGLQFGPRRSEFYVSILQQSALNAELEPPFGASLHFVFAALCISRPVYAI